MNGKSAAVEVPRQVKLLDVKVTEAQIEAERYSDMRDSLEAQKAAILQQGEKVVATMRKQGQKTLTYTDQYGYKRSFTIVDGVSKLHYSKREEA